MINQFRPTWLEIDLNAVAHNHDVARQAVKPHGTRVFPVIKDNAYGLGAVAVAHALNNAPGFCIALLEEAVTLRQAGITQPLLLVTGIPPHGEETVANLNVTPFIFHTEQAQRLARVTRKPAPLFLKVDTGMARLGFPPEQVATALAEITRMPGVRVTGLASHLALADDREHPETPRQIQRFRQLLAHREGLLGSLANSAGILGHPASHFDIARPGIMLYGASPFFPHRTWQEDGLRPVVTWRTRILQTRTLHPGESLGYGHLFTTQGPCRVAWLPVGYGDGYCRSLGQERAQVLIHGQRAPVVGRVCMDLVAVDVSGIPGAGEGTLVTLLGQDGAGFIGIEEMARWQETIPYEVITRISPRVPRRYTPFP